MSVRITFKELLIEEEGVGGISRRYFARGELKPSPGSSFEITMFPAPPGALWPTIGEPMNEAEQIMQLEAKLDRIQRALSNHPRCDIYPHDEPIYCGWKRAVLDVQKALEGK